MHFIFITFILFILTPPPLLSSHVSDNDSQSAIDYNEWLDPKSVASRFSSSSLKPIPTTPTPYSRGYEVVQNEQGEWIPSIPSPPPTRPRRHKYTLTEQYLEAVLSIIQKGIKELKSRIYSCSYSYLISFVHDIPGHFMSPVKRIRNRLALVWRRLTLKKGRRAPNADIVYVYGTRGIAESQYIVHIYDSPSTAKTTETRLEAVRKWFKAGGKLLKDDLNCLLEAIKQFPDVDGGWLGEERLEYWLEIAREWFERKAWQLERAIDRLGRIGEFGDMFLRYIR